jgi:hypothetical protein
LPLPGPAYYSLRIFLVFFHIFFSCSEINDDTEFLFEQDCFSLAADVEEGVEEKWWKLAESLLREKRRERYTNYYVDF